MISSFLDDTHADFLHSSHTEKLRGITKDAPFSKKNILLFAFQPNNSYDLFSDISKCTEFLDKKKTTSFQGVDYDVGRWTGRSFHYNELVAYRAEKQDGLIDSFDLIRANGEFEHAECVTHSPAKSEHVQLDIGLTTLKFFQFLDFVYSLNKSVSAGVLGTVHLCIKNADSIIAFNNTKEAELDYLRQDGQWMCGLKNLKIPANYDTYESAITKRVAQKLANAFGYETPGCYKKYGEFKHECVA